MACLRALLRCIRHLWKSRTACGSEAEHHNSATKNMIPLAGGKAGKVYGGHLHLDKATGAADLHAVKNSVVLTNVASESNPMFHGAYIDTHDTKGSLQTRAAENSVTAEV